MNLREAERRERPFNGNYWWPTARMTCPISIALLDGISSSDTAN
jgi:hypothetical protein